MSDVVILSSASEFFVYFVFASRVILSIHLFFGLRVDQIYSLLVIQFVMLCPRNSSIVCV